MEGPWQEIINGEVVETSPNLGTAHAIVAGNIYFIFGNYLKNDEVAEAFGFGLDLHLTERDRFMPDGMVLLKKVGYYGIYGAPDLVVEVLSPVSAKRDRGYKMELYGKFGVREYWLVNPADKSVEIYLLDGDRLCFWDVHILYPAFLLDGMEEKDRAKLVTEFKCSLFDDLVIRLEDIFYRVDDICK